MQASVARKTGGTDPSERTIVFIVWLPAPALDVEYENQMASRQAELTNSKKSHASSTNPSHTVDASKHVSGLPGKCLINAVTVHVGPGRGCWSSRLPGIWDIVASGQKNDVRIVSMPHLVLLGDSIFDNAHYTSGGPDVVSQVRSIIPPGWDVSLLAVDGSTTTNIP